MRVAVFFISAALCAQQLSNSVTLIPKADDSATGILAFREKIANGVNTVGFRAPDSIASNVNWTLPSADGTSGYCLSTNGSAVLSFADCGAGIWQRNTGLAQISPINTGDDVVLTGGDILFTPTNTSNIGTAANYANAVYSRRYESHDGTYSRIVLNSPGSGSNTGNALSILNASGANVLYVSYGGTTQAANLSTSGTLTVTGNATFSGHILNDTAGTKDIGASGNTFQTLYVENVDAAPSGQTGNYMNTRKLNVMDASGGIAFWDVQANATIANADNYKIRDKGGVVRFEMVNQEEVTWAALAEGRMNLHWVPYATATWDLGKSGGLWRDLYLGRNAAVGGDATVSGMVKVDVIRPDTDAQTTVRTLYPEAADTYNLGTWPNRFYLVAASAVTTNRINFGSGSTIELYGNLRPLTDDNFSLGEASYRYTKAWVKDLDISGTCSGCGGFWARSVGGGVGGTNIVSQATSADEIVSSANVYPSVDNSKSLGLASRKWSDVHSVFGTFTSNVSVGGTFSVTSTSTLTGNATFAGDILASANETKNVGSTTNRFNAVYSRRFEAYDGTHSRIVLNNPGSGSNTGNALAILNASGGNVLYVSYGGTTQAVALSASSSLAVTGTSTVRDVVPEANNTYALGASGSSRFSKLWVTDVDLSGTCTGCLPVADTTSVVKGSADATKLLRFEVDGFTTVTTRVLTPQNADYTIAGTNISNTFSAAQTVSANLTTQDIIESSNEAHNIGSTTSRFNIVHSRRFESYDGTYSRILLNSPGAGSNAGTAFSILNATGVSMISVSYGGTTQTVTLAASNAFSVTGTSTVRAVVPEATNTYALGASTSSRFSKLWVTDIDMSGTCTGCPGAEWTRTVGGGVGGTNIISQTTAADEIVSSANVYPSADNSKSLGLASRKWSDLHSVFGTFTSNVSVGGTFGVTGTSTHTGNATFAGDILANANETKNVGSTTNRFNAMYSRRFEANDGTYGRIVLNNPGAASNTGNALSILNASGSNVLYVSYGGTTQASNLAASGTLNVTGVATISNNLNVGAAAGDHRIYGHSGDGLISVQLFAYNGLGGFLGTLGYHPISFRTVDTDRWVLEADGHFRPQGTNLYTLGGASNRASNMYSVLANFSGTATVADIAESSNEAHNIGSTASRFNAVYSRRFEAYDGTYSRIVLNNPGAGSNTGNALSILNASGSNVLYVSYGGTTQAVSLAASNSLTVTGTSTVRAVVPETSGTYALGANTSSRFSKLWVAEVDNSGPTTLAGSISWGAHNSYSVGTTGTRAAAIYGVVVDGTTVTAGTLGATSVSTSLVPSSDSGGNLGSQSVNWNYVYADGTFYIIYGASSIRHEFGQNGLTMRTTGLAQTFVATAASGNLVAGTITSGTTTTGGVYLISDGSVTYSGIGTTGTPTTLNVRKSDDSGGCTITVRGGIITGSTC